ncbi:hypothetical protein ACFV9E_37180 [Streptomyces sp. NPDC059835]|uniref:hypothetical protein n=1 Tax=Streptomyces sp. NPDC059835 TaxID=3346967 RepID=UPI00366990C2
MSVNLTKTIRAYFLVADDECANVPGAHRPDFRRFRNILLAEAAPTDAEAYAAREDWIHEGLRESQSPLLFLTYQAVSTKHAIRLARRDYEADRAREAGETEPAETTTLDARGVLHLMYGPCGATFRRVPVIHQPTGERIGYTTEFGHPACGLPGIVVRFVEAAHSDRYVPIRHCPEHQRR